MDDDLGFVDVTDEERVIEVLKEHTILSPQQAAVYAKREIMGKNHQETADELDISGNTVSQYLMAARDKIKEAEETLEILDQLHRQRDLIEEHSQLQWEQIVGSGRSSAFEEEFGSPEDFLEDMMTALNPEDIREHYPEVADAIDLS